MTPTHSGDLSASLQLAWALSAPDAAAAGSLWTGLLGTLLASPGAQLLSLLFRLSQVWQPVHAPCSPVLLCHGAPALTAASLVQDAGGPSRVNACRSRSPLVGAAPGEWVWRAAGKSRQRQGERLRPCQAPAGSHGGGLTGRASCVLGRPSPARRGHGEAVS